MFVTHYNKFFQKGTERANEVFLSHFVIKAVHYFEKCQDRKGPVLIDDVIVA